MKLKFIKKEDEQSMLIKPKQLHLGDKVAIVSLSAGTLGESFASH